LAVGECVVVVCGGRLHFGFYNFYDPGLGLAYGGVGVGVSPPRTVVRVCRGGGGFVGPRDVVGDVEFLRERGLLGGCVDVYVFERVERHVGLGSTTQLRLAIALGYSVLEGLRFDVYRAALEAGRGFVSGVGLEVFHGGGLVVDSGRPARDGVVGEPVRVEDLPRAIARVPVPRDWRFVIIVPAGRRGPGEGPGERGVLARLEPEPPSVRVGLRDALISLLVSVRRGDLEGFGRALEELDRAAGMYFSRVQGGRYCCWETEAAAVELSRAGGLGAGQSSWGPAAYAVAAAEDAERVARKAVDHLKLRGVKLAAVYISEPLNHGAVVRLEEGQP
jgi:beta-ribofuranosylaminobenzene 5'-phosphate synthase